MINTHFEIRFLILTIRLFGYLRIFQWNISRSLDFTTWVYCYDNSPYNIIIGSEFGWSMINEWSSAHWHIAHSAGRFASILWMGRSALIRKKPARHYDSRPWSLAPGTPEPIRPRDFVIVYQQAWMVFVRSFRNTNIFGSCCINALNVFPRNIWWWS